MPDSNLIYPPTPQREEPWWKPKNLPWWNQAQTQQYEETPWAQRPFTAFGLIPPKVPFPEPPSQLSQAQPTIPTYEDIMAMDVSLEGKDAAIKKWHPERYAEFQDTVKEDIRIAEEEKKYKVIPPKPKDDLGEDEYYEFNEESWMWVPKRIPYQKGIAEEELALVKKKFEIEQQEKAEAKQKESQPPPGFYRSRASANINAPKGYEAYPEGKWWGIREAAKPKPITPYEQEQLDLDRDMFEWQQRQSELQTQKEQRNYLANLAAEPRSWLEYAAASGETPMVQPWQIPLMPQQYAGTVAGSPLPGWQGTQESMNQGAPSMAQLPALTTPSAQYLARMGPTAYQQYSGYEQARSGITPEEQQFRLWSQAPPSGQYSQLSYAR